MSQYQIQQTLASRLYRQIAPPKGIDYYEEIGYGSPFQEIRLPKLEELEIIKSFEDGRRGEKPQLIQEKYIANIDEMFHSRPANKTS